MKLLIMIICIPFTNMWFINCISYSVFMIFYYIIQSEDSFLHICAAEGHTDVCSFLILKGANINQVDRVSIVFHYSCVTTDNIQRIYPFWQRCKTCYIMWEKQCWVKLRISGGFVKAMLYHELYNRTYISVRR